MCTSLVLFCLTAFAFQDQPMVINASDLMRFSPNKLNVKVNQEVTVILRNKGRIADLKHNFVLVDSEAAAKALGNAAAVNDGNIPNEQLERAIVISEMVGPGEEVKVTFVLKSPGTYYFFSSYPGSSAVMRGTVVAQ